ncbi:MAG TPA: HlyD family efflux transporter periplasmic adaptor subunit, partial [Rudaea sp.]|nr:HlyD family efflux transporter periplasmic adaptor subunit [Rudaea sp.]
MDIIRESKKTGWSARKKTAAAGLTAVAVVLIFAWRLGPALPNVPADSVFLGSVKRGEIVRQVSGPGVLVPMESRLIPSILPKAQVERIVIQPGTVVKADTVLLQLSNPLILQQRDEAQSRLAVAVAELAALKNRTNDSVLTQQAEVARARTQYETAKLQVETEAGLVQSHIIPLLQYRKSQLTEQQAKTQLDIELKRLDALPALNASDLAAKESQVALQRRQLDLEKQLADSLEVKAGIDGIVQEIRVKEGEGVDQGQILAVVAQQDKLKAEIRIIESQAKEVLVGQKVAVEVGNVTAAGTVSRIAPSVISGTVTVDVAFAGDPPQGARNNLRVNGTIEIERLENVLYISKPAQAQENSDVKLFKVDSSGVATLTPVKFGRASVSTIEILDGLSNGDRVVLSDISELPKMDRFR